MKLLIGVLVAVAFFSITLVMLSRWLIMPPPQTMRKTMRTPDE